MVKVSNNIYLNSKSGSKIFEEKCDIIDIWDVLSKRWSLLILRNLSTKNVFEELKSIEELILQE
jgi:DNA-binding HxlR family transcriptional regulator